MAKAQTETDDTDALKDQIADMQETIKLLMQAAVTKPQGGITASELEPLMLRMSQVAAEAQERANNPSNKTHPGISVYSYPEGDRARPRSIKCPMTWIGTRMDVETTTATELELLNMAVPGEYFYTATDGQRQPLTVEGERDAAGAITKLNFKFDATKDRRPFLPGIVPMLREAFQVKTPEQLQVEAMARELAELRAQAR